MKKSKILKCLSVLAFVGCAFTLASCGTVPTTSVDSTPSSSTGNSETSDTGSSTSIVEEVKALVETLEMKVGGSDNIKDYYEVNPTKGNSLSSAQQRCSYVSADEKIVKFSGTSSIKAVSVGETTVTITSKTDTSKSCTIKVVVKDVFFDPTLSMYDSRDDLSKEHPNDGGVIRTESKVTSDFVVKGIEATRWYAECKFVLHSVDATEKFPKLGIFAATGDNTTPNNNRLYYFLDAAIGDTGNSNFFNFGVCEVENGGNWAWNEGIPNATARHNDACYTSPSVVTYETEFTMGLLRDGLNFHCYVNGEYRFSITVLDTLFGDGAGGSAASYVGFFQFNSDATFSNYTNTTADETVVSEKLAAITTFNYNSNWAAD